MGVDYDFSGWATRNNLKCSDGRTIRKNAFIDNDGAQVPLVWNHQHNDSMNVLGHAMLENRPEGVYAYCKFNDTEAGKNAKLLVQHGDVNALSIFANNLREQGGNVLHGMIREVSLVLAGANPGAYIDTVMAHSDDAEDGAIIYTDEEIVIEHGFFDEDEEVIEHADNDEEGEEMADKSLEDVLDTLNEEQLEAVKFCIGQAMEDAANGNLDDEGDDNMKHNAFESEMNDNTLAHAEEGLALIMAEGKRYGSLKESFLEHAAEYGIENIEYLQPEDHDIYDRPEFINNQPSGWVNVVLNGVHNTPFAKVRMMFADITEDEARAKGYTKGNLKKEEVFKLLKRSIGPTTIYKKQKFDRDDLIDASFDVVPWIRKEMELKLDEEKARAYIFGDGRSISDDDKIKEDCIIPVVADAPLYTINVEVKPEQGEAFEHALITASVLAQDDYQGSGNTTGLFEAKQVSKMLLMEDKFGHRLYKDVNDLAAAMGIGKIVKVPAGVVPAGIYGVILDLNDYNVGMKDGGKKTMFDDFDIDYNQQKYLIETRQSGGLVRPFSAIVLKKPAAEVAG